MKLIAVFRSEANSGLDALLPAAVEKEPLLGCIREVALFPLAVLQDSKIFEKFADIFGLRAGDGNIVCGPRVRGDFVFAPARVAARLGVHFEKDEIGEAALAKAPGSAEAGDSAADNDNGEFFGALRRGEPGAVAQEMAHLEGIVDERSFDLFFTLERKTNERRAAKTEELAAAQLQ